MKIRCHCGAEIVDGADDLPQKGHLIPDQEWLTTFDSLDGVIDDVAEGKSSRGSAYQRAREILVRPARGAWQCRACGRLYLDGVDGQLRCFHPEGEPVDREILRGRSAAPARDPMDPACWPAHLDALVAAPAQHRLLLENASVRVLDTCILPGQTTPLHCHPWSSVLHVVSWSAFVRRDAAGTILLDSRTKPELATSPGTLWSPPLGPHTLENVGGTELRVIAVEIKAPLPA